IERATGEKIEDLQSVPVDERRRLVEKKLKSLVTFRSHFPFIGRGSILRDRLLSHEEVEAEFRKAIK
ncbi:MAG: hypothetical protein ACRESZ_00990, partial [Methylococcales bacterium]